MHDKRNCKMEVPLFFFLNKIKNLVLKMQGKTPPVRLAALMRTALPADIDAIRRFFRDAEDPNVLPRPADDYEASVRSGLFYIVEVDGEIVAGAGVFFLREEETSPVEMGSCYVAKKARGFGIQKLLVRARVAASAAFLDQEAMICTAVKPDNCESIRSIKSAGFRPVPKAHPWLLEPCQSCPSKPGLQSGRICCCDFYYLPTEKKAEQIRALLETKSLFISRSNGDLMSIYLHMKMLAEPDYRGALEEFVAGFPAPPR